VFWRAGPGRGVGPEPANMRRMLVRGDRSQRFIWEQGQFADAAVSAVSLSGVGAVLGGQAMFAWHVLLPACWEVSHVRG